MQNNGSISPLRAFLTKKWVRISLVSIAAIIVVAVGSIIIFNATKTATITFNIAPVDATIQLDGHGEYHNNAYRVHPGTHTITISHADLDSKTITIDAQSGYNTTVSAFLSTDGNFDFYELKANYDSYIKLTEIASADNNITTDHDTSAENFIKQYNKAMSIADTLPLDYLDMSNKYKIKYYAININEDCQKTDLCLLVAPFKNATEEEVFQTIRQSGYNPDDYKITFQENITL